MGTKLRKVLLILTFIGLNQAQPFSTFGRSSGSLSSGLSSRFGSPFRLSSGSPSPQRGSSGAWLSSPPASVSSSSLIPGSSVPRRIIPQGNRLALDIGNNNVRLLQSPQQSSVLQPTFQQVQPQQIQQVHTAHQPQHTVLSQPQRILTQPRQVISQPRQVISQPRQVLSQPQTVLAQPQHVVSQPQRIQTVQQVQPVATLQQFAQPRQTQLVQTAQTTFTGVAPPAVQTSAAITHVPVQRAVTSGSMQVLAPQVPGAGMMGMHSPMGMASPMGMRSPMGMMGAMNPMASMMGGAMGPMGMGMGMGMPFMSYDTMEDLFLDPDVPSGPGPGAAVAAAAAAASARVAAGPGIAAGPSVGIRGALPAAPSPVGGQVASPQAASAASVGLGHLSAPAAGASVGVSAPRMVAQAAPAAPGGASLAQVNPSVIQSALQTALSRVQQRQAVSAHAVG